MEIQMNNAASLPKAASRRTNFSATRKEARVSKNFPPPGKLRRRFSISLSTKSAEAFEWLKGATDADTDSEVIRNALRIHYVLLQRHMEGKTFYVQDVKTKEMTKVDLFVAEG